MDSIHSKNKEPIKFVKRQVPEHPYCTNWPMTKEEENNSDIIKDFIGIFPNAARKEYCEKVIDHFHWIQKTRGYGQGNIQTRQELEGVSPLQKDSDMYFLEDEPDIIVLEENMKILRVYIETTWKCYAKLKEKYGILGDLAMHKMSYSVKIQKYKPSQGYHAWHCDSDKIANSRRMMVSTLYLNTVEKGGETEFLYQNMRVTPEQGTLVLWPTYWTHPHRGNPPLEGNKYIINSWLEFME